MEARKGVEPLRSGRWERRRRELALDAGQRGPWAWQPQLPGQEAQALGEA